MKTLLKNAKIGAHVTVNASQITDSSVGDNTTVGTNAVVVNSFPNGGITLTGIPAKERQKG